MAVHGCLKVEAPAGLGVGSQVGDDEPEAVLQRFDPRGPCPVIQRGALQQNDNLADDRLRHATRALLARPASSQRP